MSGHILLIACLLAVCLPILSVQLPRTALFKRTHSNDAVAETRSKILQRPTPIRRRARMHLFQTDGAPSSPGADSGSARNREESASRKPWDPPFPRGNGETGRPRWMELPRVTPVRETEEDQKHEETIEDISSTSLGGRSTAVGLSEAECEPQNRNPTSTIAMQYHSSKRKPAAMSILCLMLGILGIILILLAFAILIAHCLAWFLVYKTEARLGEARRGLLKGGEMRLCLCAS